MDLQKISLTIFTLGIATMIFEQYGTYKDMFILDPKDDEPMLGLYIHQNGKDTLGLFDKKMTDYIGKPHPFNYWYQRYFVFKARSFWNMEKEEFTRLYGKKWSYLYDKYKPFAIDQMNMH